MRCNWPRWLWGIIPLLVLSWVAVHAEHGRLERELADHARSALVKAGFPWGAAEFQGRDAVLIGRAPQEGEPPKAADVVAAVWGVRVVDNRSGLLDKAETFVWAASRRNNRLRLTGYAPSMTAKQAILGVAKASFPGFEIVDRTTLARGTPSPDVWMAAASFCLKQLTSIKRGDASLRDLELSFAGETEDIAGYRAIKQALARSLPKGLKLKSDHVRPPAVSPFTWGAQISVGRMVLSGHVPNDDNRRDLLAAAREAAPGISVVDRMEPGSGEPQGWLDAALASVRELARLEGGEAETKDAALLVSGLAGDARIGEEIRLRLRAAASTTIKFTDNIRIKEPPPAPPTPPASQPEPPPPPAAAQPPVAVPEKEPEAATRTEVPPPQAAATPPPPPAPPPEAVAKAQACEDQLTDLARTGQIHFRLSSARLDEASFPTLDKLAEAAKTCPGMQIEVSGHASSEGDPEHNQALSQQRAQSVVSYLVRAGVTAGQLEAVGFGASRPIAPNDTSENMAKNRRIEFSVRPQ